MIVGGLWHGAGASFVLWGAAHGLLLCGEKAAAQAIARLRARRLGRTLYTIVTFHVVALLWIPFRTGDLRAALSLSGHMLRDLELASIGPVLHARAAWIAMLLCAALLSQVSRALLERAARLFARAPILARAAALLVVIQCLLELREANVQPFIYFQF
jgi:alginate O-acetyltransferase complex protein AlgI